MKKRGGWIGGGFVLGVMGGDGERGINDEVHVGCWGGLFGGGRYLVGEI